VAELGATDTEPSGGRVEFPTYQAVSVPFPVMFTVVVAEVLLRAATPPDEFHCRKV
jgi:hypothetical protein